MRDLKQKTFNALTWSAIDNISLQGIRLVTSIILARILTPKDFGLVSMVSVFVVFADIIANTGLKSALIRKKEVTNEIYSTVFYSNFLFSIVLYVIFFFLSDLLADFYVQPLLNNYVKLIALSLLISPFGIIQETILIKRITFRLLTISKLISVIISGLFGVYLAYNGYGSLAIIYQSLLGAILLNIFLFIYVRWHPTMSFNFRALKEMLSYSLYVLGGNLLDKIFLNLNTIIIGKFFGPIDLGYYSRGKLLQSIPVNLINDVLRKVSYPVFSVINDEDERFERAFQSSILSLIYINFPLMAFILIFANKIIVALLGVKWAASSPFLAIMCIAGMISPFNSLVPNLLLAKGLSKITFKMEILKKISQLLLYFMALSYGLIYLVVAEVIVQLVNAMINNHYLEKHLKISLSSVLLEIVKYICLSLAIAGLLYYFGVVLSVNIIFLFLLFVTHYGLFLLFGYILKLRAYVEISSIVSTVFPKFGFLMNNHR